MQITNLAASSGPFTTYDLWPAKCSQSGPQHESNIPRNPGVSQFNSGKSQNEDSNKKLSENKQN